MSNNGGGSWIAVNNGLPPNITVWSFAAISPYIFAGSRNNNGKVFRSSNNGTSWETMGNRLINNNNNEVRALTVLGTDVYAACDNNEGVYKTSNFGVNWFAVNNGITTNPSMTSLTVAGSNVIAGCSKGLFITTNGGLSWTAKNEGFHSLFVNSLLVKGDYVFSGMFNESVWRRPLSQVIGIQQISSQIPKVFSLKQNYPNPFNPSTNIKFDIVKSGKVSLTIFDMLGRKVETLFSQELSAGTYSADWNASHYSSGIYFYKLESDDFVQTKKMIFIK